MKKTLPILLITCLIIISSLMGSANNINSTIDKITLAKEDIPEGFMYGIIPEFAKKILKGNPWKMDQTAIKKLTRKIYPGGNYNLISQIHITIFAKKDTPHGDDIVCYIIQYRNSAIARDEIKKLQNYAGYNGDRIILNVKNNIAVYLHVDDKANFPIIMEMDKKINEKMAGLTRLKKL